MTTLTQSDKDRLAERIRDRAEAVAESVRKREAVKQRRRKANLVKAVVARFKALDSLYDDMQKLMGVDPEAPVYRISYDLFNAYLAAVAVNIGDEYEWLNWYVWDNACGAYANAVSWTEQGKKITVNVRTPLQLVRVIEGHADR